MGWTWNRVRGDPTPSRAFVAERIAGHWSGQAVSPSSPYNQVLLGLLPSAGSEPGRWTVVVAEASIDPPGNYPVPRTDFTVYARTGPA